MNTKQISPLEKSSLALAIALLLGLLPMPYGFYTILRLAAAIISGVWTYVFFTRGEKTFGIIAGAVMLLFQPFVKITMDRLTWKIVDIVVAVLILILIFIRPGLQGKEGRTD